MGSVGGGQASEAMMSASLAGQDGLAGKIEDMDLHDHR